MMKKIYLIQYSLDKPNEFEDRLKSIGKWYKYFSDNWIIESQLSAQEIYEQISIGLENESIFVIQLDKSNYWGRMNSSLWDYLKDKRKK